MTAPVRIEMIEKLIAKLLNPPMRAEQLLRVAEAVQVLDVLLDGLFADCDRIATSLLGRFARGTVPPSQELRIRSAVIGRTDESRDDTADNGRISKVRTPSAAAQALDQRGQLGAADAELPEREPGHLERELDLADDHDRRAELAQDRPLRAAVGPGDDRQARVRVGGRCRRRTGS